MSVFLQCIEHFVRREQMYPSGSSSTAENVFPTSMRCVPKTRLSHCQFETNHLFPFHSPFMKWHCFSWRILELTVVCWVSDLNAAAGLKPRARQTGMLMEAVKVLKVLFQESPFFHFLRKTFIYMCCSSFLSDIISGAPQISSRWEAIICVLHKANSLGLGDINLCREFTGSLFVFSFWSDAD